MEYFVLINQIQISDGVIMTSFHCFVSQWQSLNYPEFKKVMRWSCSMLITGSAGRGLTANQQSAEDLLSVRSSQWLIMWRMCFCNYITNPTFTCNNCLWSADTWSLETRLSCLFPRWIHIFGLTQILTPDAFPADTSVKTGWMDEIREQKFLWVTHTWHS